MRPSEDPETFLNASCCSYEDPGKILDPSRCSFLDPIGTSMRVKKFLDPICSRFATKSSKSDFGRVWRLTLTQHKSSSFSRAKVIKV